MAKKFMYVCIGILMLAAAYHLGAGTAQSQLAGECVGIAVAYDGSMGYVKVYLATSDGGCWTRNQTGQWFYLGNPTNAVESTTWGKIKAEWGE